MKAVPPRHMSYRRKEFSAKSSSFENTTTGRDELLELNEKNDIDSSEIINGAKVTQGDENSSCQFDCSSVINDKSELCAQQHLLSLKRLKLSIHKTVLKSQESQSTRIQRRNSAIE